LNFAQVLPGPSVGCSHSRRGELIILCPTEQAFIGLVIPTRATSPF
jgi:hypothetical protein